MRRCERCGGGPGDPSCGKTIHASWTRAEVITAIEELMGDRLKDADTFSDEELVRTLEMEYERDRRER